MILTLQNFIQSLSSLSLILLLSSSSSSPNNDQATSSFATIFTSFVLFRRTFDDFSLSCHSNCRHSRLLPLPLKLQCWWNAWSCCSTCTSARRNGSADKSTADLWSPPSLSSNSFHLSALSNEESAMLPVPIFPIKTALSYDLVSPFVSFNSAISVTTNKEEAAAASPRACPLTIER